jgi:hypothetical protein
MTQEIRTFTLLAVLSFGLDSSAQKPPELSPAVLRSIAKGQLVVVEFGSATDEQPVEPATGEEHSVPVVYLAAPGHGIDGPSPSSYTYASCPKLYEQLRKYATPVQRGVPPWVLSIEPGRVRLGNKPVWDTSRYCISPQDSYPGDSLQVRHEVLSLVGPWLTVSYAESAALGGGPPYHGQYWNTIDVRASGPKTQEDKVYATQVLDEASLLEALKADTYVKENLPQFKDAQSAKELLDGLGNRLAFAFYDFDERTGRAAVRIGFQESQCGMCPNQTSQLGLWVKPKPELLPHLRAAKKGQGLLMSAGALRVPP